MAKVKIHLPKIVDWKGTVFGPGEVLMDEDVAEKLIQYHDAARVREGSPDIEALRKKPAGELTADELRLLAGDKPAEKPKGGQTPKKEDKKPVPPPAPTRMDKLMGLSEDDLRQQLNDRGVTIPAEATERAQLAALLSDAMDKADLPANFPHRDKLADAGFTTVTALREAGRDKWGLTVAEADQVAGELATIED